MNFTQEDIDNYIEVINKMDIYRHKYRAKYPDRVKEAKHKWYIKNKEEVKAYNNKYNSMRRIKYHLRKLDKYLINSEFILDKGRVSTDGFVAGYIDYNNIKASVKSLIDIMESFKKFTL